MFFSSSFFFFSFLKDDDCDDDYKYDCDGESTWYFMQIHLPE